MEKPFIGLDGWHCSFEESPICAGLVSALRGLPIRKDLPQRDAEQLARILYDMSEIGQDAEAAKNRPASPKRTSKQLETLIRQADALSATLEELNKPAFSALKLEGIVWPTDLVPSLQELSEKARHAYPGPRTHEPWRGAPKKHEAAGVSEMAASIFADLTGKRPTFTTDPDTGSVSGAWPNFLGGVFDALSIRASVASQVRAISEKSTLN